MAEDSADNHQSAQQPPTLGYATHIGEYPEPQSHSPFVVLLILLAALAGIWSIVVGVMSLGDIWGLGMLLIGGGILLCWGTVGKLSANNMRLKTAMLLLSLSIAIYLPAVVVSHQLYIRQRAHFAADLAAMQSDFRHMPTSAERQVFTFEMIRDDAIISIALGAGCIIFAATRHSSGRED